MLELSCSPLVSWFGKLFVATWHKKLLSRLQTLWIRAMAWRHLAGSAGQIHMRSNPYGLRGRDMEVGVHILGKRLNDDNGDIYAGDMCFV